MNVNEHTPGPWTVTRDGQGRPYAWIDGGAGFDAVARVVLAQDDLSGYIPDTDRIEADPRAIANACLIAAAPDLARLLALYVVDHGDPIEGDCGCPMCEEANALLGQACFGEPGGPAGAGE